MPAEPPAASRLTFAQAAYDRAQGMRPMPETDPPLSVDDVLSAHELLRDYRGDMHGLFVGGVRLSDTRFTEWLIRAHCDRHGDIENTVSVEAGQRLSARQHVVCPQCLRGGITRRFIPQTVIRIEEEGR